MFPAALACEFKTRSQDILYKHGLESRQRETNAVVDQAKINYFIIDNEQDAKRAKRQAGANQRSRLIKEYSPERR